MCKEFEDDKSGVYYNNTKISIEHYFPNYHIVILEVEEMEKHVQYIEIL